MKKGKAVFVGRFQPFHKGHMEIIKTILKAHEKITIVIAGPSKMDAKNPFSFEERGWMIKAALKAGGIKRYAIRRVPDVNDDGKWASAIKKLGRFDAAYSRNPWTVRCLKKVGIPVKPHKFYRRYENCGRTIRNRIVRGRTWKMLVPAAVYACIMAIRGEDRIRKKASKQPLNY